MPLCLAVHDRSTGASTGERIGIHPRMLTRMGAEPRQQARVSHGGTTALFTLIPDTDMEEVDTIRITERGCRRLGAAPGQLWTVLALDSLLTAYLGVVLAANCFVVARRMAARHGEALIAGEDAALTPAGVLLR